MRALRASILQYTSVGVLVVAAAAAGSGCEGAGARSSAPVERVTEAVSSVPQPVPPPGPLKHGQDLWLKATFGGEKFFSVLLPQVLGLRLGFDQVLLTPRSVRFTRWGVINDPGCTDGDATTGGLDRCTPDTAPTDPDYAVMGEPSGVVGIRELPNPAFDPGKPPGAGNSPFLFGVSCAGCHAGLNPASPPADPNHPTWDDITLTMGNQYLQAGRIFEANLPESSPEWQVFHTWAPGTVDTTAIENDGINNPGIITQFFHFGDRPYFTVHQSGLLLNGHGVVNGQAHRAGQGGEDDVGCQLAATRVYFNIGMCAAECMLPHLQNGPGGSQTPIDLTECAAACADFDREQADVPDLCAFFNDHALTPPPRLADAPGGQAHLDLHAARRGAKVFARACADCHSNGQPPPQQVWSDDLLHRATGFDPLFGEPPGGIGTNACRSLTTNWLGGHIWAAFSSDEKKAQGAGYTRDVPLLAIWATAPFLHNNRLGTFSGDPSVAGRLAAFEDAYAQLVNPWLRDELGSIQRTTVPVTLSIGGVSITLPAGTPVDLFANLDPATLQLRCGDLVENGGHYFGALLSPSDKDDLKEFLKTL
jgi:mono/diheme cytochrome c family protein